MTDTEGRLVDVIVPVYRGLHTTRACVESVIAARQATPHALILIDDACPDPALSDYVRAVGARGDALVLRNEANLGFVATVNRGMGLHPDRDVVLLNSDTLVANDWLDRLRRCCLEGGRTATATPLSNNATICSYPYEGWSGGVPGTLGLAALDALIAEALAGVSLDIPTGVGFCMYIRREALDQTGLFDVDRFGRGYGEENDFCMRAAARGWGHRLAADVFVFHEGGVSFADDRSALQESGMRALLAAHPDYLDQVRAFIAADPLAEIRARIDRARMARGAREEAQVWIERGRLPADFAWPSPPEENDLRPVQLHVCHSWGGGTARWIEDCCAADRLRHNLLLRSITNRNAAALRLELVDPARAGAILGRWDLSLPIRACSDAHPEYAAILHGVLAQFDVRSIVASSLVGHSLEVLQTGLPTALVLHDLFPFCPAMFAHFGEHCTSCERPRLARCLAANPYNAFWHNTVADEWIRLRSAFYACLAGHAVTLIAPTAGVLERWRALAPTITASPAQVIPHGIDAAALGPPGTLPAPGGRKSKLVIPGRLSPHKGLDLLRAALPDVLAHADLLLLGSGDYGREFAGQAGIEVVPDYRYEDLGDRIRASGADAALLLSVLPESFSYTLSEMRALGLPVLATRVGAFVERIVHGRDGLLFEPTPAGLAACVAAASPVDLAAMRAAVGALPVRDRSEAVAELHAALPLHSAVPRAAPGATMPIDRAIHLRADRLARAQVGLQADVLHQKGLVALRDARILALEARLAERPLAPTPPEARGIASRSRLFRPWSRLARRDRRDVATGGEHPPHEGIHEGRRADPRLLAFGASRSEIRARVRYWLGIPDASRIVLAIGAGSAEVAQVIVGAAHALAATCNAACVVVIRGAEADPAWRGVQPVVIRLVAARRLFFVPLPAEDATWLLAADVLLDADPASASERARMARDAGLHLWRPESGADTPEIQAAEVVAFLDQLPAPPAGLAI